MDRTGGASLRRRAVRASAVVAAGVGCWVAVAQPGVARSEGAAQPELGTRGAPIVAVDGLRFRDLDRDGALTPYEDWRLLPEDRAADLVSRMTLEEKAGTLVHGTLASRDDGYDAARLATQVGTNHVTTLLTRLSRAPATMAAASNAVQEAAEQQRLGIPVLISSDPRNGFSVAEGITVGRVGTTAFPEPSGLGAARDPELTRRAADVIRREYRAVGIHEALSPQADLATEPRWVRHYGTFGSSPEAVKAQVQAYVEGMQGGANGLGPGSVATVTKHWVGFGAQDKGIDSHYHYGRYAVFPGGRFAEHLVPFTGAFAAQTAGIMPTYSILRDLEHEGRRVEQVGAGFNRYLLRDLLRGAYGFRGVVVSDWGITNDCAAACRAARPPMPAIGPGGIIGTPWGMEDSTVLERTAKALNAGVDQIGGTDDPAPIVQAVQGGLVTEARVDQSARRVLEQRFALGLFENPYVDPDAAARIAGSADLKAVGDAVQAASLTLLRNRDRTLPASREQVRRVFAHGVDDAELQARGLTRVTDPAQADLAIVRLSDPHGGLDPGSLRLSGREPAHRALQAAVDAGVRAVAVPNLSRALVLDNVADRADAVLANYGVSDEVLLETIFGEREPGGRLPFELPSSDEAVARQLSDVPDDSEAPLFPSGAGGSYGTGEEPRQPEPRQPDPRQPEPRQPEPRQPPRDVVRPRLSRVRAAATRGSAGAAARLRFALSERASVRIAVERKVRGRSRGRACVTGVRAPRRGRACSTWRRVRTATVAGRRGANAVTLLTRAQSRRLGVGVFRVTLTATDRAGNRSAAARARFAVTKR